MRQTKTIIVGTGSMARWHLQRILAMKRRTRIVGLVEPDEKQRQETAATMVRLGATVPPFYDTIKALVKAQGPSDAALICTPHKFHLEHARDCLNSGIDVCLEKPMVMNATEARKLIRLRDTTGKLLVVAFPGSLSPAIRKAKTMLKAGAIGRMGGISAYAHQNWRSLTTNTWRQDPDISGGGFLFDTGSHMINTVIELLGEDVTRVSAIMDNRGTPVEINSSVCASTKRGVAISMVGTGDSMHCTSQITVFGDKGVLRTGIWGENLFIRKASDPDFSAVPYAKSHGAWHQFLDVRDGKIENPCPPEIGLRFALLMDMIRTSATTGSTVSSAAVGRRR